MNAPSPTCAPLEWFSSESLRERPDEVAGEARRREENRRRLRQVVPSSTWYADLAGDDAITGVQFPVDGMYLSRSKTRYPHDEDGYRHARAARRYFPAQSITMEDGLDGMSPRRAAYLNWPSAWSAQLVAQVRPRYDAEAEHGGDDTVLRFVRLAEYPKRLKPQDARRRERHYVRVGFPELADTDPRPGCEGPRYRTRWRQTGFTLGAVDCLTWPWPTSQVDVIEHDWTAPIVSAES